MPDDILRPHYHVAPVTGTPTVFAFLEYPKDKPPKVIQVGDETWVLRETVHEIMTSHG